MHFRTVTLECDLGFYFFTKLNQGWQIYFKIFDLARKLYRDADFRMYISSPRYGLDKFIGEYFEA